MHIASEQYPEQQNAAADGEHFEIDRLCGAAAPFVEPAIAVWPDGVPADLADRLAFHLARHELYGIHGAGGADLVRRAVDAVLYAHESIGVPCRIWRAQRTGRRMASWTTDPANEPKIKTILASRRWWPGTVTLRCWQALVRAVVPVYAREGSSYDEIGPRVCALAPVSVLHGRPARVLKAYRCHGAARGGLRAAPPAVERHRERTPHAHLGERRAQPSRALRRAEQAAPPQPGGGPIGGSPHATAGVKCNVRLKKHGSAHGRAGYACPPVRRFR